MDDHELEVRMIDTAIDIEATWRLNMASRAHELLARSRELSNMVIGNGMTIVEAYQAQSITPLGIIHPAVFREIGNSTLLFSAKRKSRESERIVRQLQE